MTIRHALMLMAAVVGGEAVTAQPLVQPEERPRIGLFGNYAIGLHSASFDGLPGIPNCCPEFSSTTGSGFFAGLGYRSPLSSDLVLDLRMHYGSYGVDFVTKETKPIALANGSQAVATLSHELSGSFSQISVEPLLGYRLTRSFLLHGGVTAGFVMSSTFEQAERLEEPSDAAFAGDVRTRNPASGDIPGASSLALGITVGASYDLPLNSDRTVLLTPEVYFTFNPMPVATDVSWNTHQIRAGFGLSFIPPEVQDSITPFELYEIARTMTPPVRGAANVPFTASISAVPITESGQPASSSTIRVEEFASTRIRPLLPYVFFDQGASELPYRYYRLNADQQERFSVENFYNLDAMTTYYHLLNIVGRRMQDDPTSTLTIVGCADGSDGNQQDAVAPARAKAVQDYLASVWDIDPSRLPVQARRLPEQPSKVDEADGQAENRRVELQGSTPSLLAPVMSKDTTRVFSPAGIRFQPAIDPRVPIASWTVFVSDAEGNRLLKTFYGNDPIPASVDWRIDEQARYMDRGVAAVDYMLVARDSAGLVIPSATQSIPVNYVSLDQKRGSGSADRTRDRYSLILFGFDKSDLSTANQSIVNDIKGRITPLSTVRVVGYSDRTGAEDYNQRLSEQRARSVARALGQPESAASGVGERLPLYDNDTPEGRFYSRTVDVLVETPR